MFAYGAAGLTLAADVRLPHLPRSGATSPDLVVHTGRRPSWASKPMSVEYTSPYLDVRGLPTMQLLRSCEGFSFDYSDGCLFWIDACGSTIWTIYESTLEDACTYLVGPVLSFARRRRRVCRSTRSRQVDRGGGSRPRRVPCGDRRHSPHHTIGSHMVGTSRRRDTATLAGRRVDCVL